MIERTMSISGALMMQKQTNIGKKFIENCYFKKRPQFLQYPTRKEEEKYLDHEPYKVYEVL